MNSGPVSAGPTQGITPVAPSYPSYPPNALSAKLSYPGEEAKTQEWEPEFRETFSKGILKMHLQEYHAGKYTKRYIEAYLEFMHLSGHINNLEYLEFKNVLLREQL